MTISSTVRRAGPFRGTGAVLAFPFTFKVFDKTDVGVIVTDSNGNETQLTLDSDYSVALNSDQNASPGGTVSCAVAVGLQLVILGDLPYEQPTDLTNQGGFYPEVIEDAFDRAAIQIQQLVEMGDRTIRYPTTEVIDAALPKASDRASMVLGFDQNGYQTLFPVPASVGAGDLKNEVWKDGVHYTAGTSTSVTLSRAYGAKANLGTVVMAGVAQDPDTYSLSGNTLTFLDDNGAPTPIPLGVSKVWCIGGTTVSLNLGGNFMQDMAGAVVRPYLEKMRDIIDVRDFDTVASAITAVQNAGGGLIKMRATDATALPANFGSVLLEFDGPNTPITLFGETLGSTYISQKVYRFQDNAVHPGHGHSAIHIQNEPYGTGASGPTNADFSLTVSCLKQNFSSTSQGGELDAIYIVARNGGSDSDTTAILADVAQYGAGFNAILEGNTSGIAGNVVTHQIDTQIGVVDTRVGNYVGYVATATVGTLNAAFLAQHAGGQWTSLLTAVGQAPHAGYLFDMPIDANQRVTMRLYDGTGGRKTVRASSNDFSVMNAAESAEIMTVDDAGNTMVGGQITATAFKAGTFIMGGSTDPTATAGSAVLPANPVAFLHWSLNGSTIKIPYYAS